MKEEWRTPRRCAKEFNELNIKDDTRVSNYCDVLNEDYCEDESDDEWMFYEIN